MIRTEKAYDDSRVTRKEGMEMREFVFGTDNQYMMLKEDLNDGMCHVYRNCVYPQCCSRASGRIGFEKNAEGYALFIDKGITCSRADAPSLFRQWLSAGTLKFVEFTDMKTFLRSLRYPY